MKEERIFKASSGYLFLVIGLLVIAGVVVSFINEAFWLGALLIVLTFLILPGLMVVNPNESMVMVLFGAYRGTVRKTVSGGLFRSMSAKRSLSVHVTLTVSRSRSMTRTETR
jgi:hypothetical protein